MGSAARRLGSGATPLDPALARKIPQKVRSHRGDLETPRDDMESPVTQRYSRSAIAPLRHRGSSQGPPLRHRLSASHGDLSGRGGGGGARRLDAIGGQLSACPIYCRTAPQAQGKRARKHEQVIFILVTPLPPVHVRIVPPATAPVQPELTHAACGCAGRTSSPRR
jgi:hypothetical protein